MYIMYAGAAVTHAENAIMQQLHAEEYGCIAVTQAAVPVHIL